MSDQISRSPWSSQVDNTPARLAVDLMDRYHQASQHLKVLRDQWAIYRQHQAFTIPAEHLEAHRAEATGIFTHMVRLLQAGLISVEMFCLIVPRAGASLWLECVAPLDHALRQQAAARSGTPCVGLGETVIEVFYAKYAETGDLYLAVPQQPTSPDVPVDVTHH